VSRIVPLGSTTITESRVAYGLAWVPHVMPEELLATIPPIVQATSEAGSGPSTRPRRRREALARLMVVPGSGREKAAVGGNGDGTEVVAGVDDDVGGAGLAGQRGSAGAERQRAAVGLGGPKEGGDLRGIGRRRHCVGDELIVGGIVGVRIPVDRSAAHCHGLREPWQDRRLQRVMCAHRPDPTLPQRGPIRTARARWSVGYATLSGNMSLSDHPRILTEEKP